MSSHLSPKSLLFYGTMISSVAILFRVVSWYGETNLTAPPNIAGRYVSEQPLSGCPESTRLVITIQQSGVYLHGGFSLIESSQKSTSQSSTRQEDLTLSGLLKQQQVALTGTALLPATCQLSGATATPSQTQSNQIPITIQGTVSGKLSKTEKATFRGGVTLGSLGLSEVTAVREPSPIRQESTH